MQCILINRLIGRKGQHPTVSFAYPNRPSKNHSFTFSLLIDDPARHQSIEERLGAPV